MNTYHLSSLEETLALAEQFAHTLQPGDVVAYQGELGAGKTTFTRGVVKGLGIEADVSSPTFALVNEYRGNDLTVAHFDMYRISSFDDVESTGFFDYLESGAILLIEWSEKIQEELPENTITIGFQQPDPSSEERIITIKGGRL